MTIDLGLIIAIALLVAFPIWLLSLLRNPLSTREMGGRNRIEEMERKLSEEKKRV